MIDLHSHILPGIDDGAPDMRTSLEMARMQVEQGVRIAACTPHILPGVFHNSGAQIRGAVARLQAALDEAGIALRLVTGADNHVVPGFAEGLRQGHLLTLGDTRYVLVEPPHNLAPARLDELVFSILLANYVPIITHPERLRWVEDKYELIESLAARGVWMQVTSGSLTGRFGRRPKYWAERMIGEGIIHILASDAHDTVKRPPDLAEGWRAAERLVGRAEADRLVFGRPRDIILDKPAAECAPIEVERFDGAWQDDGGDGHARGGAGGGGLRGRLRRLLGR
ncbi:capsular biosynthesis protein [Starkeya koreensis]|uniref:protein-tyrosine-phosphatase n=1 Tax=Ancylobacter koreensis TaxID=266121 RepID=A0ABT0DGL3_9HYPH|nr:CpsB/CapC family capsule biosynthesis tyrosine phosphatase [Ancylobacter koreensis]MCK0206422.1 capsular biosynthesis protein [Ancylobacter koreensis]